MFFPCIRTPLLLLLRCQEADLMINGKKRGILRSKFLKKESGFHHDYPFPSACIKGEASMTNRKS